VMVPRARRPAALPAVLLGTLASVVALSSAADPTDEATAEASALFDQGVSLFENEDWAGALTAFERAHELVPHYAVLFNIGVCRKMLHRYPEAVVALQAYLREGGDRISDARRAETEGLLGQILPLVGTVAVTVDVDGAEVLVDGRSRGLAPLSTPVALSPGEHVVSARADGFPAAESRVRLVGGETQTVDLRLRPAGETGAVAAEPTPDDAGLSPVWFWSSVGLAGALAVGGAITGGMTVVEEGNFEDAVSRCNRGDTDACTEGREISDRYDGYQLATNILLPAAVAVAAAALTLLFFTDFGGGESPPATVGVGTVPGGAALTAVFAF